MLEAITLAGNAEDVRAEIAELKQLAVQAKAVETAGAEAKLSRLKDADAGAGLLRPPRAAAAPLHRVQGHARLPRRQAESSGASASATSTAACGSARGTSPAPGCTPSSSSGKAAIQVLVATEAAGEGINLQCCNILFNYDIPWNPNRLEQRMGRIHRYGQSKDCLIFNFVATNTIEGRVLQRLLEKLQEIRNALDDDAVFNVVGEVLPAAQIERVLRDYYAGDLGDADLEDRLLHNVDEGRFRAICQNALEGLADQAAQPGDADRAAGQGPGAPRRPRDHRPLPARGRRVLAAGPQARAELPHTYDPARTPPALRRYERDPDWRLPALADGTRAARPTARRPTRRTSNGSRPASRTRL